MPLFYCIMYVLWWKGEENFLHVITGSDIAIKYSNSGLIIVDRLFKFLNLIALICFKECSGDFCCWRRAWRCLPFDFLLKVDVLERSAALGKPTPLIVCLNAC